MHELVVPLRDPGRQEPFLQAVTFAGAGQRRHGIEEGMLVL